MTKKKLLLQCLREHRGIIKYACEAVPVARQTFYDWCNNDPKFKRAYEDILEEQIDHVENKLMEAIESGGKGAVTAQIFYLKTKAKHRGYIEKIENDVTGDVNITIKRKVLGNENQEENKVEDK